MFKLKWVEPSWDIDRLNSEVSSIIGAQIGVVFFLVLAIFMFFIGFPAMIETIPQLAPRISGPILTTCFWIFGLAAIYIAIDVQTTINMIKILNRKTVNKAR